MMSELMNNCKECDQTFKSERSLHAHIKKHNLTVAEYYTKYYPRKNLLTGELLPFKNKSDYFNKDFSTRSQMLKWCEATEDKNEVKEYLIRKLRSRIKEKKSKTAPCHLELELCDLPTVETYKDFFGSYGEVCNEIGVPPTYGESITKGFFDDSSSVYSDMNIFIDTREQKPLSFPKSTPMKLDFGDYTVGGQDYSYTFIDRKSESDFKSTLSVGFDRFKKELDRARSFNSFLYILVESSIDKIKKNNIFAPHRANLPYIFHNTKSLIREYSDTCQVVFSGGRKSSEYLIPRLLKFGDLLWKCDIQYYIDQRRK